MKKSIRFTGLALVVLTLVSGFAFGQTLRVGTIADEVAPLKEVLAEQGYQTYERMNNYYGPVTAAAVKQFQADHGLAVDGVAGPQTLEVLKTQMTTDAVEETQEPVVVLSIADRGQVLYPGSRDNDIVTLKKAMMSLRLYPRQESPTPIYDEALAEAVRFYQRTRGLAVDGVVGSSTLSRLAGEGIITYGSRTVSRGTSRTETTAYGEALNWWSQVDGKLISRGDTFLVEDFETGITFQLTRTYGTNHADCEATTLADAEIMNELWGGFSWERRPVLIHVKGRVIAASLNNAPHAGLDGQPEGAWVKNRSDNYGTGYNMDKIKNNGQDGVTDLHFAGSTRHFDGRPDPRHQASIRIAAGK